MPSEKFFIKRGDKVKGPFDMSFVLNVAKQGKLLPSDKIGPTDNGPWELVSSNQELAMAIQGKPTKIKKETNDSKEKSFDINPEQPDAINAQERIKQLEEQVQLLSKANSEKTTSSPRDIKNFQEQTAKKSRDDTALADASAVDGCEQNEMSRKIPIRDLPKTLFELYMARGLLWFLGLAATSTFTFFNGNTGYLFLSTVFMVGLVWKWSDGNLSEDATNYFASKEKIVSVLIFFVLIATHVGVGSTPKAFSQSTADQLYELDQLRSRAAGKVQAAKRMADKATQDDFERNLENLFRVCLAGINMIAVSVWINRRNEEWKYIEEVTGKTSL